MSMVRSFRIWHQKRWCRPGNDDPVGRRLTMSFVISRRTYNVRISISIYSIEIEISVQ